MKFVPGTVLENIKSSAARSQKNRMAPVTLYADAVCIESKPQVIKVKGTLRDNKNKLLSQQARKLSEE